MTIAEQVVASQNIKQMTLDAINLLKDLGEDTTDLEADFNRIYGEEA